MEAKVPPHSKEVETVILGAMMLDKHAPALVLSRLFTDAFYFPAHQKVFKAMLKLYDQSQPIDMVTVTEQLKTNNDLEKIGGPYELVKLTNPVSSSANIDTHIAILLELYLKREAIAISSTLLAKSYEHGTDAFDIVTEASDLFIKSQERILKGGEKSMMHYVMKVAENRAKVKESGSIGIPTGFSELNKVIGGWVSPDLIVIAARPGMGKTALMLSTLHHISVVLQKPGAVFSLEMSGEQLTERLEAIDSGIYHSSLRYNQLDENQRQTLLETEKRLCSAPIYIEDKAASTIRDIRTKSILLKRKHAIEYILIDYLQLMGGAEDKNKNREATISEISRGCKQLAKELEVPVIALSQLSRAVESRTDKMPQLSDLRESGAIEQDADEVIFLMRPEYYEFTEPVEIGGYQYNVDGLVICKIDKNRHGATKNIALRFSPEIMKYSDYEREWNNNGNYKKFELETDF